MKTVLALAALLLASTMPTRAGEPATPATPPAADAASTDLAALEQFLSLSDAELARMAEAIARVRAMTPEQRAGLRKEILAFRHLPEAQRQVIRHGWASMPADIQNGWRDMMQAATPEERTAIQTKMQSLSPDEKTRFRRELVDAWLKTHPKK